MTQNIPTTAISRRFKFSIDRGGTFTDIFCSIDTQDDGNTKSQKQIVLKLLSEDPSNYKDAPTEGIRRILEQVIHPPGNLQINFFPGNRNSTSKKCSS